MFSFVLLLHLVLLTVPERLHRASPLSLFIFILLSQVHSSYDSSYDSYLTPFIIFLSIKGHVFVLWHLSVFLSTEV